MSKSKNKEFNLLGDVYGNILNKVKTVSEGVNEIGDAPLQSGGPLEKSGFSTKVVDRRTLKGTGKGKGKNKELENFYNINNLSEEDEEGCKHAAEGCDCDNCTQCKANQHKEEDEESKACWKGYKKMGTKKKGGKTVNNCVKEEVEESLKESRKIVHKSLNNFMRQKSVFDRLYANVMKESFPGQGDPYSDEAEEGNDLDALGLDEVTPDDELGGEGEGDEVTFTLDRATAEKLHEVLMSVLGGDSGEMEDEGGIEDEGDMGEEGDMEMGEEDEEELGHAGVNAKYNDGKSNKVGSLKPVTGAASSKYTDKTGDDGDLGHAGVNAKYNDGKSNKVGTLKTGKSAFEQ